MVEFFSGLLPDEMEKNVLSLSGDAGRNLLLTYYVFLIVVVALYILIFFLLMKGNKKLFQYISKKKGKSVSLQFLEKLVSLVIVVYFIVIPLGGEEIAKSLLGSATVIAAIIGLAASDLIKDMVAGLQISVYKPFDIGSRIQLENGTAGVVEKLTLRHVVLRLVDTTRLIIPNNKISQMGLTNYSYEEEVPRAMELRFPVSYDTDLELAKKVIRETICNCMLTLNEDKFSKDDPNSKSVYFLELADSALILGATVYYPHRYRTEVVKDEVNTAVFNNLAKNGIEIPYNYINVVMRNDSKDPS